MRQRPRINDDGVARFTVLFDRVDELAFVIRLQATNLDADRFGSIGEERFQVGERPDAIDLGFASAEGPQVGTVQDKNLHPPITSARAASTVEGAT